MNPVEETTVSKETYGEVTKSNDFEILQTNEETQVIYKGKIIKTWTHTPPKDNPFIWDEACSIVWKKFERINNGDNMEQKKQQTWDSLTLLEKKDCLKESLMSSIKFAKIDNRFIQVQKYGYE